MTLFQTTGRALRSIEAAAGAMVRRLGASDTPRNRKRGVLVVVFLLIALADGFGYLAPLDRTLLSWRFSLLPRAASGKVAVAEIDGATFAEMPVWPFPRQYYAQVIDELVRAGAETILIDVDFSANSDAKADDALAAAITRAGRRVILPAFAQRESWSPNARIRDVKPLEDLAANAHVGTANVAAEPDGRIWRYQILHRLAGGLRPSLAALAVGGTFAKPDFLIDYAIQPETIPRTSFADLYLGRIKPGSMAGKIVIIGATAVELGDEFPVPAHDYEPGVVIQALAIESLLQGRALQETGWPVTMTGLVLLLAFATALVGIGIGPLALICGTVGVAAFAGSVGIQVAAPVSLNVGAWLAGLACWLGFGVVDRLHQQAIQIFRQRMAMTYRRTLMRKVVEDSFDGIIATDSIGRIELFNGAAAEMLGLRPEQAVGRPLSTILSQAASGFEIAETAGHRPHELTLTRHDGREITVEMLVSVSEVRPSRSRYERRRRPRAVFVHTFRDVSLRKTAELTMLKAMQEAVQASQAKSDFIANMSHEFRTPLNAIIGFTELMRLQGPARLKPEKVLEYTDDIHRSGVRLLAMVNDILDLSRIENDALPITIEARDSAAILYEALDVMRPLAAERRLTLVTDIGTTSRALCDDRAMHQCLLNLLSNAVKFSEPGQTITASVVREGQTIRFSVRDEGIGMTPDLVSKVGQPFLRSTHAAIAGVEGAGLGLAISRRLMACQNGIFEIDSLPGAGTTVTLGVPADTSADMQTDRPDDAPAEPMAAPLARRAGGRQ